MTKESYRWLDNAIRGLEDAQDQPEADEWLDMVEGGQRRAYGEVSW
jgi:hypothetical protein